MLTPKSQPRLGRRDAGAGVHRDGRLALYTLATSSALSCWKDNTWTPPRSVDVDEDNTAADLARDLRAAVEEISDDEDSAEETPASQSDFVPCLESNRRPRAAVFVFCETILKLARGLEVPPSELTSGVSSLQRAGLPEEATPFAGDTKGAS